VWKVFEALSAIGPMFSIAAAFGNVHGVYKPGNVVLNPQLLAEHQVLLLYNKRHVDTTRSGF
jgi:fructose-bisphosphate aldolase, class II